MKKRAFAKTIISGLIIMMVALMTISFAPVKTDSGFKGGSGTNEDPFIIEDFKDLILLSELTLQDSFYCEASYLQVKDIEFPKDTILNPICGKKPFRGSYNGNGFVIKGVQIISEKGSAGLFANVGDKAEIRNVTLDSSCYIYCKQDNPDKDIKWSTGSLAGNIDISEGNVIINNCASFATVVSDSVFGEVGGLVGSVCTKNDKYTLYIESGFFGGEVHSKTEEKELSGIGGIIGKCDAQIKIVDCINGGDINAYLCDEVGGIAGSLSEQYQSLMLDCINFGTLTSEGQIIGGLVGYCGKTFCADTCFSLGNIYAKSENAVGLLAGKCELNDNVQFVDCRVDSLIDKRMKIVGTSNEGKIKGVTDISNIDEAPIYDGQVRNFKQAGKISEEFKRIYQKIKVLDNTLPLFRIDEGEWKKQLEDKDLDVIDANTHTLNVQIISSEGKDAVLLEERTIARYYIQKKAITIENVHPKNKTYDGSTNATFDCVNIIIKGVVDNDNVAVQVKGHFENKNVGINKVYVDSICLVGEDAQNYYVSNDAGSYQLSARINVRTVMVTPISGQTKEIDEEDPELQYTVRLCSNDRLYGSLKREEGETIGFYKYNLGTLSNSNYSLMLADGETFEIIKKTPVYTIPQDLTGYIGGKLGDVVLPKGFEFEDDLSTVFDKMGEQQFMALYNSGVENEAIVHNIPLTVRIGRKEFSSNENIRIMLDNAVFTDSINITTCYMAAPQTEVNGLELGAEEKIGFGLDIKVENKESVDIYSEMGNLYDISSFQVSVRIPDDVSKTEITKIINVENNVTTEYEFNANDVDEDGVYKFYGNNTGTYYFVVSNSEIAADVISTRVVGWVAIPVALSALMVVLALVMSKKRFAS